MEGVSLGHNPQLLIQFQTPTQHVFNSINLPQEKGTIARAESQPLAMGKLEGIHEQGKTEWQLHEGGCASQRDQIKLEQSIWGGGGGY